MNRFRISLVVLAAVAPLLLIPVSRVAAVGPMVSEYRAAPNHNKHNLSAKAWGASGLTANENPYRATDDPAKPAGQQICIFCHTPHNANVENQAPLWNRKFSEQTFSRYSSDTLQIRVNPTISALAQYGASAQPDGASKLCLSCHDGVSLLNTVLQGGPIDMVGGNNVITGRASFNPSTNKMKFGHHPVSFVYTGTVQQAISSARIHSGFKLPTLSSQVKLDRNNKMQCTTCHNPHQNQSDDTWCYDTGDANNPKTCYSTPTATVKVVPFWVLHNDSNDAFADHDAVCNTCHKFDPKPSWP